MDDFDDYPVTPRSDEDMEEIAGTIRKRLGMSDNDVLTALEMLARLSDRCGVEIVVRPDAEMGRKEAYVTSKPDRIFFRESTFRAIEKDEFRGRMTVAHEAIHLFTHPGAPKARAADGNSEVHQALRICRAAGPRGGGRDAYASNNATRGTLCARIAG